MFGYMDFGVIFFDLEVYLGWFVVCWIDQCDVGYVDCGFFGYDVGFLGLGLFLVMVDYVDFVYQCFVVGC